MFNGKCKVWQAPDGSFIGEFTVEGSKTAAKLTRIVRDGDSVQGWGPNGADTQSAIQAKMEYIAGFLPLKDAVGEDTYGKSVSLFEAVNNEDTRGQAEDEIGAVKEAAAAGDENAYDVDYALRRMAKMARAAQKENSYVRGVMDDSYDGAEVDEIGFKAFKKLGKFVKKNPVTAGLLMVAPPVAAMKLVMDAKKRQGASRAKVLAIRRLAQGMPPAPGAPVPSPAIQAQADRALFNLRAADATASAENYEDAPPEEYYDEEADENADNVGAMISFKGPKALARISKVANFVNKQKWVASLPMVGPGIAAAATLAASAKLGDKAAQEKIKTIATLAQAGVPKAEAAAKNLGTANELLNKAPNAPSTGIVGWFKRLLGIK